MEYVPLATYFAIEDERETKSEYFDGVIAPMPPSAFNMSALQVI